MTEVQYSIGTPGEKWGIEEKHQWLEAQNIQRSYGVEVVLPLEKFIKKQASDFELLQYGTLNYAGLEPVDKDYPVFAVKNLDWDDDLPSILVTGGVHGYETSGVQGALKFLSEYGKKYLGKVNLLVFPCISPWAYETINRWNPYAIDPNRSFYTNSPSQEASAVMLLLNQFALDGKHWAAHIDLHETTDSDNEEFRPALAARDGTVNKNWNIPDGFYLVGHTEKPAPDFQKFIINRVKKVTHIAPSDENNQIIGADLEQPGVINYDKSNLGLCGGVTDSEYVTTTEVYPDSSNTDPENCNDAQVAAVKAVIDFILKK